jgi:hypothetical protein
VSRNSKTVLAELVLPWVPRDAKPTSRPTRYHHHVYVVELAEQVWNEARFRRANPDHQMGKPLVYIGMTGLDPDLRFDKHKAGIQSNRGQLGRGSGG